MNNNDKILIRADDYLSCTFNGSNLKEVSR
jgi:hypothetical protein